jgi:hypothetical protein
MVMDKLTKEERATIETFRCRVDSSVMAVIDRLAPKPRVPVSFTKALEDMIANPLFTPMAVTYEVGNSYKFGYSQKIGLMILYGLPANGHEWYPACWSVHDCVEAQWYKV